ncbi:hypothetical protein PIB30_045462 [Stylosanthes scabra]|uniref:Uncharacterized protein n=1 Tax=Stylosanthes scabra TaxID=79078 RepID=A0ABU6UFG3_9FABA|nr:hypothetical protein [Stylosanthes scabra]
MDLECLEWKLPKDFQLPNKLRYIEWNKCPLKFVPSICWPQTVVELSMQNSNVHKLWDTIQNLPSLEKIDLHGCKRLKECPNLAGARNLKFIKLSECESLHDVHPSIFSLPKIEELDVENCMALKRLCSDHCSPSLHRLWATGCSNLKEFSIPMKGGGHGVHSKLELYLLSTALSEVPSTVVHLNNLNLFGFNISYSLSKLPQNFAHTIALMDPIKHEDEHDTCIILSRIFPTPAFLCVKELYFFRCKTLSKLPDNIHVLQSLQLLVIQSCGVILSLPESIKNLQQLMQLFITDCEMLQYVPPFPPSIVYYCVVNCKSLETISSLTSELPPRRKQNALSRYRGLYFQFGFHNCTKLDDHAYEAVLKDLKSRIELVASDEHPNNNGNIFYYLPSKERILNEWFPHYYSTEASIIVEVPPNHHKISSSCLVVCMLLSEYRTNFFCKKDEGTFVFECYLEKGCNEWEWLASSYNRANLSFCLDPFTRLEMESDHVAVWYDPENSNKIMEAIIKERKRGTTTCNPILKFKFKLYANHKDDEEDVIKGCGIRWMHVDVNDEGEGFEYDSDDLELENPEEGEKRAYVGNI